MSVLLWVLRTGAPWRDRPERFRRWTGGGVWARVLAGLQREADAAGRRDAETQFVDGAVVRAHQHAAGAAGGQEHQALGRSRGGSPTQLHLRAEGGGKPLAFVVSGGERHESRCVEALRTAGRVRRAVQGRPRGRPERLVGDKGYSYPTVRRLLARRHIRAVIPRRRDQRPGDGRHGQFDSEAYRARNRVERLVSRLKQHRRVATRYEKRAAHYLGMVTVAAVLLWL